MNRFTIFKVKNGWIVLRGKHDYIADGEAKNAFVFTSTGALASFFSSIK